MEIYLIKDADLIMVDLEEVAEMFEAKGYKRYTIESPEVKALLEVK